MRNLNKQYGRVTLTGSDSVGKIKRCYSADVGRTNDTPTRSEVEAQALRAFAASGFGEAAISGAPHRTFDSVELYHRARQHRAYQLGEIISALLQAVADAVRPVIQNWRRQQQTRATYRTLQALDSRTLRDLGFHRSELLSVATELATGGNSTRVRTQLQYGL